MKKYLLLLLLVQTIGWKLFAQNPQLSELEPYLKRSIAWTSPTLNKDIPLSIYFQGSHTENPDGAEVIVYLKNKAWPRIGQESDLSILRDYIQKKFIVITVDYGNDQLAVSPYFDNDLHELFKAVYGFETASLLSNLQLVPMDFRCFFLPEGYRVATDLTYWEIDKHAVYGTMEFIMQSYNEDIISKYPGMNPVTSPKEMVDKKGKPFDFTVKMDIVYPSQPNKKLPVIFCSDMYGARNPNEEPSKYIPHFAGFTTRGYVYVLMGHCYNPCVTHFFHFAKFTLDHENGYACYTAGMRFLHANAGKYAMDTTHIGGSGYSKGEYAITRLSDPHHETRKEEVRKFEGFPDGTPEPQPWPGHSSKIQAGMQGMGMGLFETQFITSDYAPNLIVCGELERKEITEGYAAFIERIDELDANYLGLFMQGLGHTIPYGYDERMGIDRYQLVHDFFDRYLKVDEKLPPVVLVVSPVNNSKSVPASSRVSIQFAPVIDEKTILENGAIKLIRIKTNKEIKGMWKVSRGGSKFTFHPASAFGKNEQFKIIITTRVKNKQGTALDKERTVQFNTGNE